jgi:hypothetical protein
MLLLKACIALPKHRKRATVAVTTFTLAKEKQPAKPQM